ncbi:MAG: DEAD/DEAH box helicase family protein [Bacillota bacterium]
MAEFYQPLLSRSTKYDRAVGYFTSKALVIAAQGLRTFIDGNGKMRLVASPHLTDEDFEAISRGYDQREVVNQAIVRPLWTEDEIVADALGFLAWLVAEERLEIRIGIPVDAKGRVRTGLYHEKMGIFTDAHEDRVAFSGSANETGSAFGENFESIDVFWSWEDPQGRVARKVANFEQLWDDTTPGLSVIPFPEAAKNRLSRFKPDRLPVAWPIFRQAGTSRPLRAPQIAALKAWYDHGRRGILSMATGAGKTYTALVGALETRDAATVIIAVPSTALVDQWVRETAQMGLVPSDHTVIAAGAATTWMNQLGRQLHGPRDRTRPLVIIGTLKTLSSSRFRSFIGDIGNLGDSLLIVDEVHNVGAPVYRSCLYEGFTYRLGLSATPVRPFDEQGTDFILSYFGGVVYEYDLADAIRDGLLCPYDYHIWFAYMSEEEMDEYRTLSARIATARHQVERATSPSVLARAESSLEALLMQRARIVKECRDKVELLPGVLSQCRLDKTLVYCADENQLEDASRTMTSLSIPFGRYTASLASGERERLLSAFARGTIKVLLAIKCLDEGVDVPAVDEAIVIASSRSEREFIQRRGRILRASQGKSYASLHDFFVLPPNAREDHAKNLIRRELARAHSMLKSARNRFSVENRLEEVLRPYGLRLSEILGITSGEELD